MQNRKQGVDSEAKNSGLFGEWQVEIYKPEIAKNGKVPRNDFGNVDLYQECMLPIGCVWIKDIDDMGLFSRVCRKLNIDAAKAVTGFDGKKGYPVCEGYVMCKEFEDVARDAYNEQFGINIEKKEKERKALVRRRWRRAAKAVLVRKKVNAMFEGKQPDRNIERILMRQIQGPIQDDSDDDKPGTSFDVFSSSNISSGPSRVTKKAPAKTSSQYFEKEVTSEEEASLSDKSSSSEEEVKKISPKKRSKKIPIARSSRRRNKPVTKYDFSSDSSEFENSEDDYAPE